MVRRLLSWSRRMRDWESRQTTLSELNYRLWPLAMAVARWYRRTLARRIRLVVVIGSLGKTSTMRMISTALGVPVHPWAARNANALALVGLGILRIRPWQRIAVVEVGLGARGQMIEYARALRPDVVVATSIASDHSRALGTLEETRDEKAIMVRALQPAGLLIANGDDPHTRWMAAQTTARSILYGCAGHNDVRADSVVLDWPRGSRLHVVMPSGEANVTTRFIGRHMAYPVLAALAAVGEFRVPLAAALERMAALAPQYARMQPVALPNGAALLRDEFKSSAETVFAALEVLAAVPARRRIVVMGDITDPPQRRAEQARLYSDVGRRIGETADLAIFLRGHSDELRRAARRGGLADSGMRTAETVADAAAMLQDELAPGDVVLLKGRVSQRLDRVALILQGQPVRCRIPVCNVKMTPCEVCRQLLRERPDAAPKGT